MFIEFPVYKTNQVKIIWWIFSFQYALHICIPLFDFTQRNAYSERLNFSCIVWLQRRYEDIIECFKRSLKSHYLQNSMSIIESQLPPPPFPEKLKTLISKSRQKIICTPVYKAFMFNDNDSNCLISYIF